MGTVGVRHWVGRCGNRASAGSHGVDLHLCALRLAVHCNLETSRCGNGRLALKATSTIDLGAGNCMKLHQFIAVHTRKVCRSRKFIKTRQGGKEIQQGLTMAMVTWYAIDTPRVGPSMA